MKEIQAQNLNKEEETILAQRQPMLACGKISS